MTGGLWKTRVIVGSVILFVWIFDSSLHIQNTSKRKCHLDIPPKYLYLKRRLISGSILEKNWMSTSFLGWLSHLKALKHPFTHSNQNRICLGWTNQSNHVFQREDWISISSLPGNPYGSNLWDGFVYLKHFSHQFGPPNGKAANCCWNPWVFPLQKVTGGEISPGSYRVPKNFGRTRPVTNIQKKLKLNTLKKHQFRYSPGYLCG